MPRGGLKSPLQPLRNFKSIFLKYTNAHTKHPRNNLPFIPTIYIYTQEYIEQNRTEHPPVYDRLSLRRDNLRVKGRQSRGLWDNGGDCPSAAVDATPRTRTGAIQRATQNYLLFSPIRSSQLLSLLTRITTPLTVYNNTGKTRQQCRAVVCLSARHDATLHVTHKN